ncbi:MAG: response regulator transcription factor [Polyangiales bacterium]
MVEPDRFFGTHIERVLGDAGYFVGPIDDAVNLVILELGSLARLSELRETSDVPVIVLAPKSDTAEKIRALQAGADDFLAKPLTPEELLAHVQARLRRQTLVRATCCDVGDLRIDLGRRSAELRGSPLDLTRVEFDLLAMLSERPGKVLPRKAIATRVLPPDRDGGERTLDVHVSRLRKKLGTPDMIETTWGVGYRLRV